MRERCVGILALLVVSCLAVPATAVIENYGAKIDNAQEQAAGNCLAGSTAKGKGSMTFDTVSNAFTWNITFGNNPPGFANGLLDQGAEGSAHIHIGAPGVNGGVTIGLATGSPKTGGATLTAGQKTALQAGLFYVNIHSAGCGAGEIRGQVLLAQVPALPLWAWLAAVAAFAVGYAVVRHRVGPLRNS